MTGTQENTPLKFSFETTTLALLSTEASADRRQSRYLVVHLQEEIGQNAVRKQNRETSPHLGR
jgi:hypothetical protein